MLLVPARNWLESVSVENERAAENVSKLEKAATILGVPLGSFEQHSCRPVLRKRIQEIGRRQLIFAGMGSLIEQLANAPDLRNRRYDRFMVVDAILPRLVQKSGSTTERMHSEGISVVTTEMVLFEWLERAATPEFRRVLRLIK